MKQIPGTLSVNFRNRLAWVVSSPLVQMHFQNIKTCPSWLQDGHDGVRAKTKRFPGYQDLAEYREATQTGWVKMKLP